jgi:hypothetical protein
MASPRPPSRRAALAHVWQFDHGPSPCEAQDLKDVPNPAAHLAGVSVRRRLWFGGNRSSSSGTGNAGCTHSGAAPRASCSGCLPAAAVGQCQATGSTTGGTPAAGAPPRLEAKPMPGARGLAFFEGLAFWRCLACGKPVLAAAPAARAPPNRKEALLGACDGSLGPSIHRRVHCCKCCANLQWTRAPATAAPRWPAELREQEGCVSRHMSSGSAGERHPGACLTRKWHPPKWQQCAGAGHIRHPKHS